MIKKISLFSIILCSLNIAAQKDLQTGFLVRETNDTIFGKLKNKEYYSKGGVRLYQDDKNSFFSKRVLSEIHVGDDIYVKSDLDVWFQGFFKKEISGNVNLYTYKKTKKLGGSDSDIGSGRLIPAIRFYCSDYPDLTDSIRDINKNNVAGFIKTYNDWKQKNPGSKSFFEKNIHTKPLINFKMSFLLPRAGIEIGLNDNVSISTILKNEFGYGSSVGWIINPFIDTQLRFFHNIDKRRAENKRTYKYSGNYFCFVDAYFLDTTSNLIGIEYGWQRMVNKHWYYNLGIGAGKWTTGNQLYSLLYDFDFGYNL